MQCQFVLDVDVDVTTLPDDQKTKIRWRKGVDHKTGRQIFIPYFPLGTKYEHDDAPRFVNLGMAVPADAECEAETVPMSAVQRQQLELGYKATSLGIHDKHDRELFFAGVIAGYEVVGDQMAYLPGPNWETWNADQKKAAEDKTLSDDV